MVSSPGNARPNRGLLQTDGDADVPDREIAAKIIEARRRTSLRPAQGSQTRAVAQPKDANEKRAQLEQWLQDRPDRVKETALRWPPWLRYRMRPGAPYELPAAGCIVSIRSYTGDGECQVVVVQTPGKAPRAGSAARNGASKDAKELVKVKVDPQWLEPIADPQ